MCAQAYTGQDDEELEAREKAEKEELAQQVAAYKEKIRPQEEAYKKSIDESHSLKDRLRRARKEDINVSLLQKGIDEQIIVVKKSAVFKKDKVAVLQAARQYLDGTMTIDQLRDVIKKNTKYDSLGSGDTKMLVQRVIDRISANQGSITSQRKEMNAIGSAQEFILLEDMSAHMISMAGKSSQKANDKFEVLRIAVGYLQGTHTKEELVEATKNFPKYKNGVFSRRTAAFVERTLKITTAIQQKREDNTLSNALDRKREAIVGNDPVSVEKRALLTHAQMALTGNYDITRLQSDLTKAVERGIFQRPTGQMDSRDVAGTEKELARLEDWDIKRLVDQVVQISPESLVKASAGKGLDNEEKHDSEEDGEAEKHGLGH